MYNFDPYNVLLAISTNIPQWLKLLLCSRLTLSSVLSVHLSSEQTELVLLGTETPRRTTRSLWRTWTSWADRRSCRPRPSWLSRWPNPWPRCRWRWRSRTVRSLPWRTWYVCFTLNHSHWVIDYREMSVSQCWICNRLQITSYTL